MSSNRLTQPSGNLDLSNNSDPVIKSINDTKAEYKRLGNSGLRVSVPILGAMSFGKSAIASKLVDACADSSVFDIR